MTINEVTGPWAVLWLDLTSGKTTSCWAFFHTQAAALKHQLDTGGELWTRDAGGNLKRA